MSENRFEYFEYVCEYIGLFCICIYRALLGVGAGPAKYFVRRLNWNMWNILNILLHQISPTIQAYFDGNIELKCCAKQPCFRQSIFKKSHSLRCTHTHPTTQTKICPPTHTRTRTHAHAPVNTHAHTQVHAHTHTRTHTHIHTHFHIYIHNCTKTCTYAFSRTYTCNQKRLMAITLHNIYKHTATHCNTLQHTLYCNTLRHTTTRYKILQHRATHCTTLLLPPPLSCVSDTF